MLWFVGLRCKDPGACTLQSFGSRDGRAGITWRVFWVTGEKLSSVQGLWPSWLRCSIVISSQIPVWMAQVWSTLGY